MADEIRLQQLGEFLRSRRDRIAPETVGISPGPRRRSKGLRREEVADLAGVGVTWYTWLEQARDIHVSDDVLAAIARALRLDADETTHLFALARCPRPQPTITPMPEPLVPAAHQAVLDALDPNPAHIRDRRWNLLAWNDAFAASTGFDRVPPEERNLLWLLFTQPTVRQLVPDWEDLAEFAVAHFRFEVGPFLSDDRVCEIVDALREQSPEFCKLWSICDVYSASGSQTEWKHPRAGRLELERCAMALDGPESGAGQRLLHVLVPVAGSETGRRMGAVGSVA